MKKWLRLTPDEAIQNYHVPAEMAQDQKNQFFGFYHEVPEPLEGEWPLVAFLNDPTYPSVTTLHICSLPMEYIHDASFPMNNEDFNPLSEKDGRGYINLKVEQALEFGQLLHVQAESTTHSSIIDPHLSVFRQLSKNEINKYRLIDDSTENEEQRRLYIYEPQEYEIFPNITIVEIATEFATNKGIYFSIMTFNQDDLNNDLFDPMFDSIGQIKIDKQGLIELAQLLFRNN